MKKILAIAAALISLSAVAQPASIEQIQSCRSDINQLSARFKVLMAEDAALSAEVDALNARSQALNAEAKATDTMPAPLVSELIAAAQAQSQKVGDIITRIRLHTEQFNHATTVSRTITERCGKLSIRVIDFQAVCKSAPSTDVFCFPPSADK